MAILHSVLHHQDVEESEEEEVAEEADDSQTKSKKKSLNKAERLGYSWGQSNPTANQLGCYDTLDRLALHLSQLAVDGGWLAFTHEIGTRHLQVALLGSLFFFYRESWMWQMLFLQTDDLGLHPEKGWNLRERSLLRVPSRIRWNHLLLIDQGSWKHVAAVLRKGTT